MDRRQSRSDRRAQLVSLTPEGRRVFRAMARAHEGWIAEIFADLAPADVEALMRLLAKTKASAREALSEGRRDDRANPVTLPLSGYAAQHVRLAVDGPVATLTLTGRSKNPLTFESYAELANIFRAAARDKSVKAIVITGAGGNFCSGGDVFEIIKPLTEMEASGLLDFTRMTGELVKAMRAAPQPIVAAIDGVCAGAGAIIAMASDIRLGTASAKVAFLFNRVGLGGCDMGACAILPRIIGQGRAAELLFTGRALGGEDAERWGFFNRLCSADKSAGRRASAGRRSCRRPDLRQCHDQTHAGDGMGHVGRDRDRGRGRGAGACAWRPRILRAPSGPSRTSASRYSRAN